MKVADTYPARFKELKERYEQRCIAYLNRIRAVLAEAEMFSTEPADESAGEYKWSFVLWPTREKGEIEQCIDVSITLEEAVEYEGEEAAAQFAMSWSLTIIAWDGTIVGELRPYNFTPEVWVDGRNDEEVEARFKLIEESNVANIPRLIRESNANKT